MSAHNIIIVVDVQNDFVTGSLGTKEAQEMIPRLKSKLEKSNKDNVLIFTKDTHDEKYLNSIEGKKLPIPHCIKETNGWLIVPEITPFTNGYNRKVIEKNTFGCVEMLFTILEELRNGFVEEIELVGLCTDICVISNALLVKSHFPYMNIVVDSSCCAGTTVENHNKALDIMRQCHIEVR